MPGMKCLVTGSAGFIGSHAVKELKRRGHDVKECDPKDNTGDIRVLTPQDLKGIDWVFHFGAASGSLHFMPQPHEGVNTNVDGTLNLLECCKEAGVKKVVLSSTGSTYSDTPLPHNESWALTSPNFYAATKIFNEHSFKLYNELYGLDTVILRYASVYGTNEECKNLPDGRSLANIVSQFIWKMMKGEQPDVWGSGRQGRDFVYVDDIVSANIFAAENLGGANVYNVGTGTETPFNRCIELINTHLGTDIKPRYCDPANKAVQRKYVDRQLFDTDKLANAGWRYSVTIDEGIRRIIENIRSRD